MPDTIGGMPGEPRTHEYTSPVKTFGIDLGLGTYAVTASISLIYLSAVFPLQALFGNHKPEPILLWNLVPIVGPWPAQYQAHAKHSPVLRALLIGDSALQASGLVLGLIGAALSGRREPGYAANGGWELNLGVAGTALAGLTVSVHTM
jgi:hypothetical protein